MQIQKLGQDFTKSFKINLLPGFILPKGYYRSDVTFVTDAAGITMFHNGSYNHGGEPRDFDAIVGQDVREITFTCHRHNSFPGNPNVYFRYTMRVDRILLLNLAYILTRTTISI
jgi:hypothetical protein